MNKGGAKAPPFIMRGSLEVSPLFYGEEAKVPRFLRGSGDGNAARASFLRQNLATFTKRYILKEEKIMHYVKSSPVSLPAR